MPVSGDMSDAAEQPSGPPPVPPPSPWRGDPVVGQVPPAPWASGLPPGQVPPAQPPSGWVAPGPAREEGPSGGQPGWLPGHWREVDRDRSAPGSPLAALLARPAPELAALVAVLAGGLLCLASIARTLLVPAGDFGLTLGDRIRAGTDVLVLDLPLVLAVALITGALGPGTAKRPVDLGALVAGAAGSLLLLLRLLAHLFADGRVFSGGAADRLATSLVDLVALVLTVTMTWWASRCRRDEATAPDPAPPPATWAQGPPPPGTRA